MTPAAPEAPVRATPHDAGRHERWHSRARRAMRHSLKYRLVALFLLLALFMSTAFLFGMQKALSLGWRDAARPLLVDYVDRVTHELGSPPSIERARELTARLPVTVRISGPAVNWASHADMDDDHWRREAWLDDRAGRREDIESLFVRQTADGHRIRYGLNVKPWRDRPRFVGWATLGVLLLLTWAAYAYVRRLLRPLEDIGAGARRFGQGQFGQPIPVRRRDELGDLAGDVNAMAASIHQMLEAKRALLLAISHELRSPITRARLNAELLPEQGPDAARRQALLRDLQEMADLVSDLLESERLGQGHAALHIEPTDLAAMARDVVHGLRPPSAEQAVEGAPVFAGEPAPVQLDIAPGLPQVAVDRTRLRLVMRNLLDNALRHSQGADHAPVLRLALEAAGTQVLLSVRDHGPGVDEALLRHLGEPFWRADQARERATGGVGLGLYLCRLVAQAHGGAFSVHHAQPGLRVEIRLPLAAPVAGR